MERVEEVLATILDPLDRRLQLEREPAGQWLLREDVALEPEAAADVRSAHAHHDVVAELPVDERRTRRERSLRVDDGLERIVLHGDQLDGVLGRVPALGDHGRDRFPNVAYLAERQARPLALLEDGGWKDLGTERQPHTLQRTRHVLAREHTTHARQAERCT